jgi:hypothetical protein
MASSFWKFVRGLNHSHKKENKMASVASPASVLAMVAAFEAGPISGFGDAGLQAFANQIYNQGLADGTAIPAPATVSAAAVVADIQALIGSDDAAAQALIAKYSPAPVASS